MLFYFFERVTVCSLSTWNWDQSLRSENSLCDTTRIIWKPLLFNLFVFNIQFSSLSDKLKYERIRFYLNHLWNNPMTYNKGEFPIIFWVLSLEFTDYGKKLFLYLTRIEYYEEPLYRLSSQPHCSYFVAHHGLSFLY